MCTLNPHKYQGTMTHKRKAMPACSLKLFSPPAKMYQFFTPTCHDRDLCSCEASQRSGNHVPTQHSNLGRYISKCNSPLPCCMSFSCAVVCVASSKSQEAVVTSAVFHVSERERGRGSLTCMKYRFRSLRGRFINWSFRDCISKLQL